MDVVGSKEAHPAKQVFQLFQVYVMDFSGSTNQLEQVLVHFLELHVMVFARWKEFHQEQKSGLQMLAVKIPFLSVELIGSQAKRAHPRPTLQAVHLNLQSL
ncbi:U2 [Hyposoter didymator ichnovirus]|nr:U2 [Hyposoter didymator ichnovirus]